MEPGSGGARLKDRRDQLVGKIIGLVVFVFVLGSACSSGTEISVTPTTSVGAAAETSPLPSTTAGRDDVGSATTSSTSTTSTTTEAGPTGSPDSPLDLGVGFTYSEAFSDVTWEGQIQAIVETDTGGFNDEPGRCLVVVGTLTPTEISDGTITSGFSAPTISMIIDGQLLDSEVNDCDVDSVEAAGYGWILDAEVTVNTTYAFYDEFFLPEGTSDPQSLVIGNPRDDEALYYQPTTTPDIPTPDTN